MLRNILCLICVLIFQSSFAVSSNTHTLFSDTLKRPIKNKIPSDTSGRPIRINRILVIGNKVTKEQIVLRELTVKPGDIVYSTELPIIVDLDKKKLINTRLFNTVEIRLLDFGDDVVDLLIDLNERWYTFPAPIFELADRNFNEWWETYDHDFSRVNYGLRLYQYNMRGRNETLRLTAQFGFQRRFEISYRFPYIDKKQKQGLIIDFDFGESKNLAYRTFDHKLDYLRSDDILRVNRGGGLTYTYRKSFYVFHALKIEYRSSSVNDTIETINPRYFGEGKTSQQFGILSYQFTNDHRDYVGYPLVGHFLNASIFRFGLMGNDDVKKVDINLNFAAFINLNKNFFLSVNTIGLWSSQKDIPYANFTGLGYRKQLVRGYEVFVIEGPFYALNKTTLKYRLFSRTYNFNAMPIRQFRYIPLSIFLKTYGDIGYVKSYPAYDISNRLSDKAITGIGAGIDIVASYDAVFRFEYSLNGEGERGFFFHIKKEF
ncbi:MAG: POTRA domain-containing protein [Chryseolinea sp.]